MWVVIAWREESMVPVEGTGRPDIGRRARMLPQWEPHAVVWARVDEGDALIASARKHARRFRGVVYQYPDSELDPIGRAKRDVMAI